MASSPDPQPRNRATTALFFLVALPLMVLVAAVFIRSIELKDDDRIAEHIQHDAQTSAASEEPASGAAATDPPATTEPVATSTSRSSAPMEPKATTASTVSPPIAPEPPAEQPAQPAPPPATKTTPRTDVEPTRYSTSRGILVEELNKETYNALTELHAVVESQAWDDAARIVASFDPAVAPGVAPYFKDRNLLVSLPVAVQLAREDYAPLRDTLTDKLAALAKLRVAEAINSGNAATVEFAAVQFAESPAAGEAHRWLGERALSSGRFASAVLEYQRATGGDKSSDEELSARTRLAAAMMGREAGTPATQPVHFGEVTMSAAKFESLVAEMRKRNFSSTPNDSRESIPEVPPPSRFDSHVRSRLDGPVGERPQDDLGRRINQLRISWADRQLATIVEGDVLYVANRFQVAAYSLASGECLWQSQAPPGQMQRSQEWGLIPMRPLIIGDRIFVRLLYSPNPLLVSLDRSSGKLLWVGESRENEFLVSDPLLLDGYLIALSVAIQPDQQGVLRFNLIDRQSGEIWRVHDVIRLRSTWGTRACCQIAQLDDGIAVALGGAIVAIDRRGNIRWLRTQATLPPDDDPYWVRQLFQPPLVKGERLYVAQPGVRTVDCLSAATGRLHWSANLPEIVGIIGFTGDVLAVQTTRGFSGLDLTTGTAQWEFDADDLFSFHVVDDKQVLIAARERAGSNRDHWQPRLTWLNAANGKPMASTPLGGLAESDTRLGPLVPFNNRLFAFLGHGQQDATRDIVELIPKGEADRVP